MLTKTQAQELKAAGWPQTGEYEALYYEDDVPVKTIQYYTDHVEQAIADEKVILAPSLSQLIGACGEDFECVVRRCKPDLTTTEWVAHSFVVDHLCTGSTPEEAVKNLWMAIQKNK